MTSGLKTTLALGVPRTRRSGWRVLQPVGCRATATDESSRSPSDERSVRLHAVAYGRLSRGPLAQLVEQVTFNPLVVNLTISASTEVRRRVYHRFTCQS